MGLGSGPPARSRVDAQLPALISTAAAFFQEAREPGPRRIDVEHDAIGVDLGSSKNLAYQIMQRFP